MKVEIDQALLARHLREFGEKVVRRATRTGMSRTMAKAKTAMNREIRGHYKISAAEIRAILRITRSGGAAFTEIALEAPPFRGRALNLIRFNPQRAPKGLSVSIKRGSARPIVPGAFIANKGRTVFRRTGKARLPIQPVRTIGIPQMFNTRSVRDNVEALIREQFPVEFQRAATHFSSRRP